MRVRPRFGRWERLRRPVEFARVSQTGRKATEEAFVLLVAAGPADRQGQEPRLGITVSRKVGKAAARNRVKRRVREWFRHAREDLRPGIDLVVIARSRATRLSGREASGFLCGLAERAGAKRP